MDEKNKTVAFYVLAATQVNLIFTISLIFVPLPLIALEMDLLQADLVMITAAYGLPYSGLLLFGGRLTDKYEAKTIFTIGLTIFALASLLVVFAFKFELLLAMRFMQGVGGSLIAPSAIGLLKAIYTDDSQFNKAMAQWGSFSVIGAALGPVFGGVIISLVSWRWLFLIPLIISAFAILFTRFKLREISAPNPEGSLLRLDIAGTLLATLAISIGSYALIVVEVYSWSSMHVIIPLMIGILLLVTFFIVQNKARSPLLPLPFLKDQTRGIGLVGILLAAAASSLAMFLLTLFLQQIKEWTPLETAGAYLPFAIVLIVMNKYSMHLIQKWGTIITTLSGFLICTIAFTLLTFINENSAFGPDLLPGYVLLPTGLSMIFAGSAVLSTTKVKQAQIGLAGGVMNTSMELGPTVGLAIFMSIAAIKTDVVAGYGLAFKSAGIAFAVMCLLVFSKAYTSFNKIIARL